MVITKTKVLFWDGPFSNFDAIDNFQYKGNVFFTSEQAFMYEKAKFFNDKETADYILNKCRDPLDAKSAGRMISPYDNQKWDEVRFQIMFDVNLEKYKQSKYHFDYLMKYAHLTFVEASPYDKIWGIGLREDDPWADDESKWQGQNLLGEVLDKVVESLS